MKPVTQPSDKLIEQAPQLVNVDPWFRSGEFTAHDATKNALKARASCSECYWNSLIFSCPYYADLTLAADTGSTVYSIRYSVYYEAFRIQSLPPLCSIQEDTTTIDNWLTCYIQLLTAVWLNGVTPAHRYLSLRAKRACCCRTFFTLRQPLLYYIWGVLFPHRIWPRSVIWPPLCHYVTLAALVQLRSFCTTTYLWRRPR